MYMFSNSGLWFLFFVLACISFGLLMHTNKKEKENYINDLTKSFLEALHESNFKADDYYGSIDMLTGIAINEKDKKIALLKRDQQEISFNLRKIDFRDIVEVSTYEDGGLINKVSRGSQISGALVGGVLAGGVGAIIGGLSGKSHSNETSNKLSLLIVIDDLKSPYHEINFSLGNIQKDTQMYEDRRKQLNNWFSKLKVIVNQNE